MKIKLVFYNGKKKKYNVDKLHSVTITNIGVYVNSKNNTTNLYEVEEIRKIKIK